MRKWDQPKGGITLQWLHFASLLLTVLATTGGCLTCEACGLSWQRPIGHFDGVDEQGHVSYSEQIGTVDLDEGLTFPLFIIFNSSWETSSPYLGKGWNLCLLESRMEQVDENTFKLVQPDGWYRMFGRGKANDTVLSGQGAWKAEIMGDTITAYADCGWKLTFNRGKIVSMTTPKGQRLDWVYEDGHVSELREGNISYLKVEYGADARAASLVLPNGRIFITHAKKPRVQTIGGQNIITNIDNSLGGLTLADGRRRSYTFTTDEKVLPVLTIEQQGSSGAQEAVVATEHPRVLSWNPQNKLATRDGDVRYQIDLPRTADDNAAIQRTNAEGKSEYWYYNSGTGEEVTQALGSPRISKHFYTSGVLAGMLRSIEYADNPNTKLYKAYYDEHGRLIREVKLDSEARREYKTDRSVYTLYVGGKLVSTEEYDLTGRPLVINHQGGTKVVYTYNDDHAYKVDEVHSDGYRQTLYYSPSGHLVNAESSEGNWSLSSLHALLSRPLDKQ